jgi:hypothetical protein
MNNKKKLKVLAKCPLCKENFIVKENTLASYEKPDQYEIAVGIKEAFYYRKWVRCYSCSLVFQFTQDPVTHLIIYMKNYTEKLAQFPGERLARNKLLN